MRLMIVSGRSGSGKSITLNVLEDLGYYCIDNLPINLLPKIDETLSDAYKNIAISIDVRNITNDPENFSVIINSLKNTYNNLDVIFLDADDNTLLERFSETRRRHPLTNSRVSLKEALKNEKALLQPLYDQADLYVDTSSLNIRELFNIIHDRCDYKSTRLSLLFQSFGYKNGVPTDTDFIFDVRCLPNPYWEKSIRNKTGLDQEVINFLNKLTALHGVLDFSLHIKC